MHESTTSLYSGNLESALRAALAADPTDPLPRAALHDWLIEQGREDEAWAYGAGWACVAQAVIDSTDNPCSRVRSVSSADALADLLGMPVPMDRRTIAMGVGDEALVFRLVFPPGTPRIAPGDKGALGRAILAGHYELGLLRREA